MNIRSLLEALDLQEDAARALAVDLRAQVDDLRARLREAETRLERLAITRKTVTDLADRLPASPHPRRRHQSTRTTRASSLSSTRRPAPCGPETYARPSATKCCRRTSKAPGRS